MVTAPPSQSSRRIDWMDALRGLSILVVVLDHTLRFSHRGDVDVPPTIDFFSDVLNPLRMPLMVFLSGLLLQASLAKGAGPFLAGKIRHILYPFLVWSVTYVGLLVLAGGLTGTPHQWSEFLAILWDPPGHMWFLRDLFVFYLLMLALRDVPRPILIGVALALSVLLADIGAAQTVANNAPLQRFWFLFACFALGDWVAARSGGWWALLGAPSVRATAVIGTAALVPVAWAFGNVRYEIVSIPMVLAGFAAMTLLTRRLCRTGLSRPLCFLGRESLVVYVIHWLMVRIAVEAVRRVPVDLPDPALVLLAFALGLGASVSATLAVRRFGLGWLFVLPRLRPVHAVEIVTAGSPTSGSRGPHPLS